MTAAPGRPWAVVLAGGVGRRFWPASTPDRPKQLLPLGGERPLLLDAVERARAVSGERVRIVAGEDVLRAATPLIPDLPPSCLLREPEARGTGPALAWAAHEIAASDPGAAMISMHADHVIEPRGEFIRTAERAVAAAREGGRLYCIGVRPDRPETGYGYVELGAERSPGVFEARRFVEKPGRETAARYVDSGRYMWNTGIFVWRAADLLAAIRRHTPEIAPALPLLDAGDVEGFFRRVEPVSIDVGVMERAEAVGVVEATFRWDDVGVWSALARTRGTDPAGNTVVGPARLVDASENIVWAEGGRVTLFGVEGLVVVRTEDETLVMPRERAGELKLLLERAESAAPEGGR